MREEEGGRTEEEEEEVGGRREEGGGRSEEGGGRREVFTPNDCRESYLVFGRPPGPWLVYLESGGVLPHSRYRLLFF